MISPWQQKACYSKLNFVLFLSAQELGFVGRFGHQHEDLDHRKKQRSPVSVEL